MIEFSGKRFLPRLYIHPIDALPKSTFHGKIKVNVRKIIAAFVSASGVAMDIAEYADRKWRSVWLVFCYKNVNSLLLTECTRENK